MRNPLFFGLVLLAAGCGGPHTPTEPSGSSAVVSGRVLGFADGAGVPGVAVAFGDVTAVTDATGAYTATVATGRQEPVVDALPAGQTYVTGSTYRGDFLVRSGNCVSRYGVVADARTLRPIAAAAVSLGGTTVTTERDGWYRVDLGCPSNGLHGFNTIFIYVSHGNYSDYSQIVGRGVYRVSRLDILLQPR